MQHPKPDKISLADFLEWEQSQLERLEWVDGDVLRCEGGSDDHAAIVTNLTVLLANALGDGPCFVRVGSERKLVSQDKLGNNLGRITATSSYRALTMLGKCAAFPERSS